MSKVVEVLWWVVLVPLIVLAIVLFIIFEMIAGLYTRHEHIPGEEEY